MLYYANLIFSVFLLCVERKLLVGYAEPFIAIRINN